MALTREQCEQYFKSQGRPWADEDMYDEFMNAGERQPLYDEIVQKGYCLSDVDRWFHLMDVLGVNVKYETAMKIDRALWEEDLEVMELNLPEERIPEGSKDKNVFRGSFDEVKEKIRGRVLKKDNFDLRELGDVCVPDLTMENAFKLYAALRGEIDGAKTLFLMGPDELFDLSRDEDIRLLPYEFKKIVDSYYPPEDPLHAFIEQEVPFRMKELLEIDISNSVCADLVESVSNNVDVMFDYDRLDAFLVSEYEKLAGLDRERINYLRGAIYNLRKELGGAMEFDPDLVPAIVDRLAELHEELDAIYGVKPQIFVFDDELILNDDNVTLNGYLWAIDVLVERLPEPEGVENVNFYSEYNVSSGLVKLTATYDTPLADGELNKQFEVSLDVSEAQALIAEMEKHCEWTTGMSCLTLVNKMRQEAGLAPVETSASKMPLEEQICAAQGEVNETPSLVQKEEPVLE